jgi:hypothetical protein
VTRLVIVATAIGALVAIAATSAFGDGASFRHGHSQISAEAAFVLPSSRHCLTRPELTLQLRKLPHVHWVGGTVKVNGKRVKVIERSQAGSPVQITNLPTGRIVLTITAVPKHGRSVSATRIYQTCATEPVNPTTPTPPANTPPPISPPVPGSYTALTSFTSFAFYVSPDGTRLEDVSFPGLTARCAPGNNTFGNQFYMPEIAIKVDGSFSATRTEKGDVAGHPAEFTSTFSGQILGATGSGALREDVTYENGVSQTCTSNLVSWSATRDAQPPQTPSPPEPGSYTALTSFTSFAFYVSPDGTRLEDVSFPGLTVRCAPGNNTFGNQFYIPEIAISGDGSFSGTVTEKGDVAGNPAEFTSTFSGHLHGHNSAGKARIAGALREDVTYENGVSQTCTSDIVSFAATRDAQPPQTPSPPEPGSYTALTSFTSFSFSVSSDGSHLQNVSLPGLTVRCAPGNNTFGVGFFLAEVAIDNDGSFAATHSEAGVVSGHPATFTYTFRGHFHGNKTCTSNIVSFSAIH